MMYTCQLIADLTVTSMTLSDKIFHALAKDIVSGKAKPGERLDEPSICRTFAVSRTPVREALRRLSGTGLVEVTPQKGVMVARIDLEQLTDMFEALAEFEGLCARLSAVRMTALEKKRLEILNAGRKLRMAKGGLDFAMLNTEFHELIYQGAHSASIAGVTRGFRQRIAPFRDLQFVPGQTEHSFREHDDVVRAILASNSERAYHAMRDHVTRVGVQAIENLARPRDKAGTRRRPFTKRKAG
jgi:DNA-binding GntR family transcriptional regulator